MSSDPQFFLGFLFAIPAMLFGLFCGLIQGASNERRRCEREHNA